MVERLDGERIALSGYRLDAQTAGALAAASRVALQRARMADPLDEAALASALGLAERITDRRSPLSEESRDRRRAAGAGIEMTRMT